MRQYKQLRLYQEVSIFAVGSQEDNITRNYNIMQLVNKISNFAFTLNEWCYKTFV